MTLPRILVVDDEDHLREAVKAWFTMRGFDVSEASTGDEAVELCKRATYDAITMDLQMPGMSGIEAISYIKQTQPQTRILVLTGYAQKTESALESGAETILTKPIRMRELEAHIRRLIES